MYIMIKENIIKDVISSKRTHNEMVESFKKLNYDFDTILEVPENFEVRLGASLNEYDESLNYKSHEQRIIEGFVPVPEGFEIKDGKLQEIKESEKTTEELLKEKIEQAILNLSMNCNDKRNEIIDDKRIMNVLTGATVGYPEYMTTENVGKVIEIFKNIYHTYSVKIKTAASIEEVEEIMKGIVYPGLEYIMSMLKQGA